MQGMHFISISDGYIDDPISTMKSRLLTRFASILIRPPYPVQGITERSNSFCDSADKKRVENLVAASAGVPALAPISNCQGMVFKTSSRLGGSAVPQWRCQSCGRFLLYQNRHVMMEF